MPMIAKKCVYVIGRGAESQTRPPTRAQQSTTSGQLCLHLTGGHEQTRTCAFSSRLRRAQISCSANLDVRHSRVLYLEKKYHNACMTSRRRGTPAHSLSRAPRRPTAAQRSRAPACHQGRAAPGTTPAATQSLALPCHQAPRHRRTWSMEGCHWRRHGG